MSSWLHVPCASHPGVHRDGAERAQRLVPPSGASYPAPTPGQKYRDFTSLSLELEVPGSTPSAAAFSGGGSSVHSAPLLLVLPPLPLPPLDSSLPSPNPAVVNDGDLDVVGGFVGFVEKLGGCTTWWWWCLAASPGEPWWCHAAGYSRAASTRTPGAAAPSASSATRSGTMLFRDCR